MQTRYRCSTERFAQRNPLITPSDGRLHKRRYTIFLPSWSTLSHREAVLIATSREVQLGKAVYFISLSLCVPLLLFSIYPYHSQIIRNLVN